MYVCKGGGGNRDVITIQTSTTTPPSATASSKCVGVGGCGGGVATNAFHSYNACWYMSALNSNGTEHIR